MTAVLPAPPTPTTKPLMAMASPGDDPERSETLRRMIRALEDLSALDAVDHLMEHVPAALCRVGFDRAMVSRIENGQWMVERFHSEVDPSEGALVTDAARSLPQRLDPSLIELEMVRRRVPLLVRDVSREPRVSRPLAQMTHSTSYVAAPVAPEREVLGFLHADRVDGSVGVVDREVIALFAHQFGALVRTAWLRERFERLQATVDHLRSSLGGMVSSCLDGGVALISEPQTAHAEPLDTPAGHLAKDLLTVDPAIDDLLSTREREVLHLMALGMTNTRIASKLVISEGTVKSHVRHILRKLNAANRAEAVSRWLQRPDPRS